MCSEWWAPPNTWLPEYEVCHARTYNCEANVWSLGSLCTKWKLANLRGNYPLGHFRGMEGGPGGAEGCEAGAGGGGGVRGTGGGEEETSFHSIVRGEFDMTSHPQPSVS